MRTTFLTIHEMFTDEEYKKLPKEEKLKCELCGADIEEGYMLHPNDEERGRVIKLFKTEEPSKWFVGECCFGGFCFQPHKWLDWMEKYI